MPGIFKSSLETSISRRHGQVFALESFSKRGVTAFMHSEVGSTSKASRIAKPAQTDLNSNAEKSNVGSIEGILLRNDRVFRIFVVAGVLIAGLVLLAIFLRWDF